MFRAHHGLRNLHCVTGSKLDNVYDVLESLRGVEEALSQA
jgi:hypothetical protein